MKIHNTRKNTQKRITFGLALVLTILLGTITSQAQATSVFTTGLNYPAKIINAGESSLLVAEAGTNAPNSGRISLVNRARTETPRVLADNLVTPTSLARDARTGSIFVTENATGRIMRVTAPRAVPYDFFGTGRSNYLSVDYSGTQIRWDILRNPVTNPPQTRRTY